MGSFEIQEHEDGPLREERPFWGEFHGGEIDEVGAYTEPTTEQREKFQKRNERLSEIFDGADFEWYLDGAVNISLYRDDQMRDHKDLDMSVFKEDLAKLEELLARQGFGIFVNHKENGKGLMQKATAEEISVLDRPDLSICKVGPDGKIEQGTAEPFNFVDLHVHRKDAQGNTVINYSGTVLSKDYFVPIKKELQNGKTIDLSQPMIVAYHKLHSDRPYDLTDLQRLRPYLRDKDFAVLREALEDEVAKTERDTKDKLKEIWDRLSRTMRDVQDPEAIREAIMGYPGIERYRDDPKIAEYISSISQYLFEHRETSFDDFLARSLSILQVRQRIEQKLKVIDQLENS